MIVQILLNIYRALLKAYPQSFRGEFGDEMLFVLERSLDQAMQKDRWTVLEVGLRELLQAPYVLLRLHRRDLRKRMQARSEGGILSLPGRGRARVDGRTSWLEAMLETSPFLIMGALLVVITYLPLNWPKVDRWGEITSLGNAVLLVCLPAIGIGLIRGAPRWIYPFAGMALGYAFLAAQRYHMAGYLAVSVCAYAALALATRRIDARNQLPQSLRRVGGELSKDWTRLSFAIYGCMPLLIQVIYDDTRFNNRTPYLAVSVCMMVLGALAYSRSRRKSWQMICLWVGSSLSLWAVLLDQAYFHGGMFAWIENQGEWLTEIGYLLELWAVMTTLISVPALLGLTWRALKVRLPI